MGREDLGGEASCVFPEAPQEGSGRVDTAVHRGGQGDQGGGRDGETTRGRVTVTETWGMRRSFRTLPGWAPRSLVTTVKTKGACPAVKLPADRGSLGWGGVKWGTQGAWKPATVP